MPLDDLTWSAREQSEPEEPQGEAPRQLHERPMPLWAYFAIGALLIGCAALGLMMGTASPRPALPASGQPRAQRDLSGEVLPIQEAVPGATHFSAAGTSVILSRNYTV